MDRTGNCKKRPPPCPVTRAMADAGKAKLDTLTSIDTEDAQVSDDQLVVEIYQAMWNVYWEQVFAVQGKTLKPPTVALILPPTGFVRQ